MNVGQLTEILAGFQDDVTIEVASNQTDAMLLQGKVLNGYVYHQSVDENGKETRTLTLY